MATPHRTLRAVRTCRTQAIPRLAGLTAVAGLTVLTVLGCAPAPDPDPAPRSTLLVGIDISGSFQSEGRYDDALAFASRYIHGHLHGRGGLERPRALFVGAIGGEVPGEPHAFHPIHDFEGKDPVEIEADLRAWFPPADHFTDFNAFFLRASTLVKRHNLALAPITVVLLSDGIPDLGPGATTDSSRYAQVDLDPLEYLARNVTVRLLYPDPAVAVRWEREVPRDRVRMWTVDAVVMRGWRNQLAFEAAPPAPARATMTALPDGLAMPEAPPEPQPAAAQPDLWRWIRDNVDFRVRRSML